MSWIAYALFGAASSALSSVIDKTVLSKWATHPMGSYFMYGLVEGFAGFMAFFILGCPLLPVGITLLALATGVTFSLSTLFYFQAINVEEVTRIVPLYNLSPILVAVFAALFLGEVLSPVKYLGVFLIILGSFLLSLKRLRGLLFGKGVGWMLLAVLTIAGTSIILKYLLENLDPWTVFAYSKIGAFFATIPFWSKGFPAFRKAYRRHPTPVLVCTFLSEGATSMATIFFLMAAAIGSITLVNALIGTYPFFLLLFTVLLGFYRPDILKEEINRQLILRKVIAIASVVFGAWLVT